jgi:glyoxylase-like metal-dependent hydrolase (beta-lactamase superfamily II)
MAPLPTAPHWFERRPVGDGITLFFEPHVHPWFRANLWHVRGRDLDLVIDTGNGIASLRAAMADLLDRPILAVATHGHVDHAGGHHDFAERAIHPAEASALEGDETANLAPYLRGHAAPLTALPSDGWSLDAFTVKAAPATRLLAEGDRIDLGGRALTVLHLPGHSPGSIGLLDAQEGLLFSGDAIYDGELLDDLPHSDVAAYAATMERLMALPVRRVHGGHGPSFDRPRCRAIAEQYLAGRRRQGCPGPA